MLFRSLVLVVSTGAVLVLGGMAVLGGGNSQATGHGPARTGQVVVLADDNPGPFTP